MALVLLLAGCRSGPGDRKVGQKWVLVETENTSGKVNTGRRPTLRFQGGLVSGSTGCNHYRGKFNRNGSIMKVAPLALTRKACDPRVMTQEKIYLDVLRSVTRARESSRFLILQNSKNEKLIFRPAR